MKLLSLEKTESLVALFGLSFVVFGWFAFSLTISSLFLFPLIATGFTLFLVLTILIAYKLLLLAPLDLRAVFIITLLYASFVAFTTEPTLFSGRDQGSIAEAAYRLAANTELAFSTPGSDSFFHIYGEGTALNFPGFAYTKEGYLLTQFPLGYIAWLASFVALFGISGYAVANGLLLFLFLFFFYQLIRLFAHPLYAGAGLLLALTSFLPSWFAKSTLTENLSVFLFVFLAYTITLFFQKGKFIFYAGALLSAGLFAFTRIEGFAFLGLTLLLVGFHPHGRALFRTYPWKSFVIPALVFTFVFLRDFFINLPYYKMIGKALFKFLQSFSSSTGIAVVSGNSFGLGSVFFLYGLLVLSLVGFFGILLFLKKKQWLLLLPAFLALPTFLYLFFPNITMDYPWMLRRYLFSLFPTLLFSAVLGIALLFSRGAPVLPLKQPGGKRLFFIVVIFAGLFLLQYPAWKNQFGFAEGRELNSQIASFASEFGDKDLILVDSHATGDGFFMLSGPGQFLYGKNTVYFFNPYDLPALDVSHFDHVYLLTPEESQARYATVFGERLVLKKSVTFSLEHLEDADLLNTNTLSLPQKTITETRNLLFQIY